MKRNDEIAEAIERAEAARRELERLAAELRETR